MVRLRRLSLGFGALIFLVLVLPNLAAKDDACRPSCRGSLRSHNAGYSEGSIYTYSFHSAIELSLANAKGQKSKTEIRATVLLTPQPQCSHLLRLQNVEIIGANAQRYSHISGIEKPIQFHFQDGVIGDHICAETDDSHNSLNIKRAVTSLFQVDTTHEYETDVFGVCPTLGKVERKAKGIVHVTKIRDLNECAYRESIKEDFMVSSFNPESEYKSTPILDGDYMSVQTIKNGVLQRGVVFENYTYLAFGDDDDDDADSEKDPGALIRVGTTLEYVGMTGGHVSQSKATESKSVIFDNPHPITSDTSNIDSILAAIREITQDNDMTVSENSARRFLNLVKVLRDSNKDDILTVYRQVKTGAGFGNKEKVRKLFLDALFRCGTGNAVVVGVELLKNRELTPVEEKLVYLGFAFIKHATLSALEAASSLLDTHNLPREAYLGIGNLAGRYCREHSCRAEAVERLTQRLSGKLGHGRVHSREEENEIIFVLKALANIQHLSEAVISKVTAIVNDKISPTRLRVAALETYLVDACHDSVRTSALSVLKDVQEDSELRIKAYLVLAKCPNGQTASALKTLLNNEPSYQVGGFIVSHLRNLQASANPDRRNAKHYLRGINTNKKFPIDPRKYSFNGEFSYDVDHLGISNSIESNVIYSQNSFLPRSTSLNLTAELFGHTVNFLEIGLRQQNLDRLMEHYFGPLGVFNQATPDEVAKTGEDAVEKIVTHLGNRLGNVRGKRDVSRSEVDALGRRVEIKTTELNNELDLDLSVKLFGSELFFLSISDDTENLSPEDIIDRFFDKYERELARGQNFNHNIETNSLFIDSQFSYPTSLGLPLRVSIEGTSSVQVKAKGTMDVLKYLDISPKPDVFKLSLIPSANIELATSITLDAQVVEGGLKLISTLHTATGGDLEIMLPNNNRGMEVKFSLLLQKQKIISATHEAVLNTRELGKIENIQPLKFGQSKDLNLCINDLSPYIGLNYCMDLNAPAVTENGYLAGNYKFALEIENEDFSNFHYKEVYFHDYHKGVGTEITAEILGARHNKKMSLKLEAVYGKESYLKASIISPIKTASIEGRATNSGTEKTLSYEMQLDNQRSTGKLGFSVSGPLQKQRFTPILEYTPLGAHGPQRLPISMQGAFIIEQKGARDFKVTFENLQLTIEEAHQRPETYSIHGNVGHEMHDYFSDVNLSDGHTTYTVKGKLHLQKNMMKLDGHLQNSNNPDTNVHVIYAFKRHTTEIDSILELIHGRDPNSPQNRLIISDSLIYKRINDHDYEITAKNKISYPLMRLDAMVDYTQTPNSILYDFEIKYDKYIVGSELDLKYSKRVEGDYDLDFQMYDEDDEIEFKSKRDIQGDISKIENVLVINNIKYELGGTVTIRDKPNDVRYSADLSYTSTNSREPLRIQEEFSSKLNENKYILKITSPREEYVDFTASTTPDNSNAKLKVTLREIILINGHATESRGSGNGEVTIDLVQQRQSIKADTTYTIHDPTYNIRLTVYPDFKRNSRSYITFTTNSQISADHFDSKNTIDIDGQKLQLNAIYSDKDEDTSGKLLAQVDITMPDGDYGAIKYHYNFNTRNDYLNSGQLLEVEARGLLNWRDAKLSVKEILKDVKLDANVYEYIYALAADDGEGRKLHVDLLDKREEQDEQVHEVATIKIYKNRDTDGLVVTGKSIIKEDAESYDISATFEELYVFSIHGEYELGEDNSPTTTQFRIKLESPNPDLQNMKLSLETSFSDDDFPDGHLELKAKGALIVNERSRSPNSINVVTETEMKIGPNDGKTKVIVHSAPGEPVTVTLTYDYDETEEIEKFSGNVAIQYERHKNIESALVVEIINDNHCNIDFSLESPNAPPTRLKLTVKELHEGREYAAEAIITTNNQRYEITELIDLNVDSPSFAMEIKYPDGQNDLAQFLIDISKPNQIEGEVKLKLHEYNFELEGSLDAQFHGEDDFLIKIVADCPALQVYGFNLEVQNKPIGSTESTGHLASRYGDDNSRRENQHYQDSRGDRRHGSQTRDQRHGNYQSSGNQMYGRDRAYNDQTYTDPTHHDRRDRSQSNKNQRNEHLSHQRYRRQSYGDQPYGSHSYNHQLTGSQVRRPQIYGEQISITAKHAGKNLLSGSASYQIRDQGYKTSIEGSGTFTVMDKIPTQYSYQLVHQFVHANRDSGEGWEYVLSIKSDSDTKEVLNGMLKYTDQGFSFLTTFSEATSRKPPLRIQVDSKTYYQSIIDFEITQTATVDLRYFDGHEVGIKEVLKNRGNVFEASGEILLDNRNKYQYKVYEDNKVFESSFTTPQRMISLEGKIQTPWSGRSGPAKFQMDFYLNKNNQPYQKTSLIGTYDCRGGEQVGRCNVELKLSDPGLQKDLAIILTSNYNQPNMNGEQNLILDIFSNTNDKIVLTGKYSAKKVGREGFSANLLYEVKSQGLNVDIKYEEDLSFDPSYTRELKYNHLLNIHIGRATYNNVMAMHVFPEQVLLTAKLFNRDVLNIDCKYHGDERRRVIDTTVRIIGVPPTISHLEVSSNRMLKLTVAHMNRPNDKFEVTGNLFAGEITDLKVEYYERGHPQQLLAVSLRMDNRGDLVYDYVYDENNIERYLILPAKSEYVQVKKELEMLEKSAERDLANQAHIVDEIAKWDLPDFKPVAQHYREELHKFAQELTNDRALQDVLKVWKDILGPLTDWIAEMLLRLVEIRRSYQSAAQAQYEKLLHQFEYEIKPWLKKNLDRISNDAEVTWEDAQKLISNLLVELNKFIGQHKREIKAIGVLIVETLEDVIVFAVNIAKEVEKEITKDLDKLYKEIKATAILEELDMRIKQALQGGSVPEAYIQSFREVVANLLDSTQSPHVKKLINLLADYIEQKLRQQPVDDATAIQNILTALYEVLSLAYDAYVDDIQNDLSISWEVLYAIPKLIAIELSPITYLLEGDWPDLEELFDSASLDLDDWSLPEDLDAVVAQGQHIFTFDGKHMTFPGVCSYLLAHDAINKNFTIVGSYSNGLLTSISFTDKHDTVTIRKGGHALLNEAPTELPIRRRHRLEVFQDYEGINIWSKAGVNIKCGPQLMVCGIHISGYYHAQLRGLLGNGNNEPYDDYTLPNGVIASNEGEFGNSYKVGHCSDVRTVDHKVRRRNPACTRLFGSNSPFSICYNFVDPENYRSACDHGLAAAVKGTEQAVATAYVASCRTKGIGIDVPDSFAKCTNYEKSVRVGEEFQVTTPGKAADIVVIVDQDKDNEHVFKELLQPLISQLSVALNSEGIHDVDFHIIGYGGEYEKRSYHYTMDGKIAFKNGRAPNVQFSKPLKESRRETFMEYVHRLEEELDLITGQDMLSDAYFEALLYPFRAHAVKSIIVFNSKPCDEAHLEQLQSWSSSLVVDEQFSVNLFTLFKGVNARDPKARDVVGFNHDSVFTFSNPAGSKEGHDIESDNFCVEFALKNRGNVFVTNNFSQGRSKMQFIQIAAQTVAKELTSVEQWLDCKCEMITAYTAQNECKVTYSRRHPTQQRKARGY